MDGDRRQQTHRTAVARKERRRGDRWDKIASPTRQQPFSLKSLHAALIGAAVILAIIFVTSARQVLLLFFSSVLLALFLRGAGHWLCRRTFLSGKWAVTVVLGVFLLALGAFIFFLAPEVGKQMEKMGQQLPAAAEKIEETLRKHQLGRWILSGSPDFGEFMQKAPGLLSKTALVLSSTVGVVVDFVIVFVVGLYLAYDPNPYRSGFIRLFPRRRRGRMAEVLDEIGTSLQRWLIGRACLMVLNGTITSIVLMLMGIPMALSLGLLTGILNFIPNIGPIVAAIPAILIALLEGPDKALGVAIFYLIYQMIDGYVFEPMVEKRTISLPPALTILVQVVMGIYLGTVGVVLAVPLVAVVLVLVKMLYIQDVLHDRVKLPGQEKEESHAKQA